MIRIIAFIASLLYLGTSAVNAADKPLKVFILAGQSNMVGWGDSLKLADDLRNGNDRVLMFENGKWQPLRPIKKARKNQEKFGMTEFSFGPEIAFAHEMAKAWPDEKIGIVKFAVGGTSILTWKPDWSKEDADRVRQGRLGSLYKKLMSKVDQARKARDIEIIGFLWVQGGGDMKKVEVAKEYLDNLKSLVAAVRKDTGVPGLPFYCGSPRRKQDPDDISDLEPKRVSGPYPAVEFVLKAQWDAQKAIPHAHTVILRDIEKHPMNVHYNTAGQLKVGKLFAKAFLTGAAYIANSEEKTTLERAFPGIQTTFPSGHPKQRGYGHQGITKGDGQWFLFGTEHIYRYDTTDFTVDQAKLNVKNEHPFAHADFKGTGIEHMGAPNYHDGKVYSFGKSSNATPFDKATMRLIWYSAADLSYAEGSYLNLNVPPDEEGNPRVVAGGPYIVGDDFYSALATRAPDGKRLPSNHIGKFALATGEFLKAIRVSQAYFQPQALVLDGSGNFYALETKGHLKKYSPQGEYVGTVFKATVPAVYEGFYLDEKTKIMTISITKQGIHIAQIRLDEQ